MNTKLTLNILKNMPTSKSIMLRAKHGVGKSSIVKQAAQSQGIEFHDVRLSQCEVGDIKGLPFLDKDNGITTFLKPYWWPKDQDSKGILFFDELNRATKDVLQAVFEICLDRRLDGEKLPDGWRVVAAVNADDEYDVVELDPALLDRWFIIEFDPTPKEWIAWARSADVDEVVIEFIARNENLLDPPVGNLESGKVYPSRRSWVSLSDTIKAMGIRDGSEGVLVQVTKGWVGRDIAPMFEKFLTSEFSQLKASDVLDKLEEKRDRIIAACSDIEVIAALADSVMAEIRKRPKNKLSDENFANLRKFIMLVNKDVAASIWPKVLSEEKTKRLAVEWGNDPEFMNAIKSIWGFGDKKAAKKEA
jgi:uncharacterized protein YbdZ (MbtH family)